MGMEISIIINTFERPESVRRLIDSIHKFYPDIKILVGDSSRHPVLWRDVINVSLPYDCGLAEGRNRLLDRVDTRYVLVLDDDFVFSPETKLEEFVKVLQKSDLDLVAGWIDEEPYNKKWLQYHGMLSINHGVLEYKKGSYYECDDYIRCDIVANFWLGETERIRAVGWNKKYKLAEHSDFFLRAKLIGLNVGITDKVRIDHFRASNDVYKRFRGRGYIFGEQFYKDWGIDKVIKFDKEMKIKFDKRKENYYMSEFYATNPSLYFDDTRNTDEYQKDFYMEAAKTNPESVLDIGCGSGYKLIKYFKKCFTVGTDIEPTFGFLNREYPDNKWLLSDFDNPPNEKFDLVLCIDVIEHLEKPEQLMEYLRKLKTHKFMITTPVRTKEEGSPVNECHVREWNIYEFHKFVKDYLIIDSHRVVNNNQVLWCHK